LWAALALYQAITRHTGEHTRQAGAQQERFFGHPPGFHPCVVIGVFAKNPQHTPLLVGQAVSAQTGPGMPHDRFARLQKQARQVSVNKGVVLHLFNMLIDWVGFHLSVFPYFCHLVSAWRFRCDSFSNYKYAKCIVWFINKWRKTRIKRHSSSWL
jgi:hypothetical protein